MKLIQRPLSLIVLLLLLLACGITIARTRAVQGPGQGENCADSCKEKLDKTMERCERMPEDRRESCRAGANEQYTKCLERCGDRTH